MQPDAPTAPSMNGSVQKDALDLEASKRTVQTLPPSQGPFYNDASASFMFLAQIADEFASWGTMVKERDRQLRAFITREDRFNSALGIVTSTNAAYSWKISGPETKAANYQTRFQQSNFGKGWANLIQQVSMDLYTQDCGAFIEIIRAQDRQDGEFIGLAHLDAARCWTTGIPEEPVWYQDRVGTYHRLKWYQVIHLLDLPSAYEAYPGLGYCALTRILLGARTIRDISIYLQEKVGGRNTRAVTLLKGVTAQSVSEAWEESRLRHDSAGMYRYSMPLLISSVSPDADIDFKTLEIASLPDGFDLDLSEKRYTTLLAMGFMRDYQDFAPLPGGNLGTSAQSEVLHAKSRGKGPGLFMKLVSEALNFYVLPDDLQFEWDEQDVDQDKAEADVRSVRGLDRKARIESGELTPEVARMIALEDGDLTQEQFDELQKQAEEEAAAALDAEVAGQLTAATGPPVESTDTTFDEGATPDSQMDTGGVPIEEQQKGFDESDWVRNSGRFSDYLGDGDGGGGSGGSGGAGEEMSDSSLDSAREDFQKKLTPDESKLLDKYQETAGDKSLTDGERKRLSAVLEKAPPLESATLLYRGTVFRKNQVPEVGAEIRDARFTSTTTDVAVARQFAIERYGSGNQPYIFYITAPAGTKVGFLKKYVTDDVDDEREGLLSRGTRIRVTRIKDPGSGFGEVHATIID